MKKAYIISAFCFLLGCESYAGFEPNDACEPGIVKQGKDGFYYICKTFENVNQWVEYGSIPACDPGDDPKDDVIQYSDKNQVCVEEKCTDYMWIEVEKEENSTKVSCQYNEEGIASMGECLNGEFECDNDYNLMVCIDGKKQKIDKDIAECTCDADMHCTNNNNIGVICDGGVKRACENRNSCHGNICGKCRNGEEQCLNGVPQICDNGEFRNCTADDHCMNICQSCKDIGGKTRCTDDAKGLEVCVVDRWVYQGACQSGRYCKDGSCDYECENGQKMCIDGQPLHCEKGRWKFAEVCNSAQFCENGECKDKECDSGQTRCDGESVKQTCVDFRWGKSESCGSKQACENGQCVDRIDECKTGTKMCDGEDKWKVCEGGKWGESKTCGSKQACENGQCVDRIDECKSGTKMCDGEDKWKVCEGGKWSELITCGKKQACENGQCVDRIDECESGTMRCDGDKLRVCENGKWGESKTCDEGMVCKNDQCVDRNLCEPGESHCEGGQLRICGKDGKWQDPIECASGSVCEALDDGKRARCAVQKCEDGSCNGKSRCRNDDVIEFVVDKGWMGFSCGWGAKCDDSEQGAKCVEVCESDHKARFDYKDSVLAPVVDGIGYYYIDNLKIWSCGSIYKNSSEISHVNWSLLNIDACPNLVNVINNRYSSSLTSDGYTDFPKTWQAARVSDYVRYCKCDDYYSINVDSCTDNGSILHSHVGKAYTDHDGLHISISHNAAHACSNGCFKGKCIESCENPGELKPTEDAIVGKDVPVKMTVCSNDKKWMPVYCDIYNSSTQMCEQ